MKFKWKLVTIFLSLAFLVSYCKSGETKLEPGEKEEMTNDDGQVTGIRTQVSETRQEYRFGTDGSTPPERTVVKEGEKVTEVQYDPDKDGTVNKTVRFENGKPKQVLIFDPATKSEKTVTELDANQKPVYTDVVTMFNGHKYVKRVFYNPDGTIDESKIKQIEGPKQEEPASSESEPAKK